MKVVVIGIDGATWDPVIPYIRKVYYRAILSFGITVYMAL